ncbi:hypothetical protein [Nonomuraea dietziae]|uniref:hypothetical protein n=1 Tax=Nonomuraea dietziae TaxID=65515 RepID=UPI0031D85928
MLIVAHDSVVLGLRHVIEQAHDTDLAARRRPRPDQERLRSRRGPRGRAPRAGVVQRGGPPRLNRVLTHGGHQR